MWPFVIPEDFDDYLDDLNGDRSEGEYKTEPKKRKLGRPQKKKSQSSSQLGRPPAVSSVKKQNFVVNKVRFHEWNGKYF